MDRQNHICLNCKRVFYNDPKECFECGGKTFGKTEAAVTLDSGNSNIYEKYSVSAHVYYKSGMLFNSTIEANDLAELDIKKAYFIKNYKAEDIEVINFGRVVKTTTIVYQGTSEINYFVDETTNEYLGTLGLGKKK